MSALASVLPFLAQLKKQVPDMSGMTADDGTGSPIDPSAAVPPNFPAPAPPPEPVVASPGPIAQRTASPIPDMGTGEAPAAPEDKGSMLRQPYETKGHALLSILQGGLVGGLSGLASNANTYAATGRNAGFGGGVGAGFTQSLPFQRGMQSLELQKAGLTNEQLIQMLPFLRAQQFAELGVKQSTAEKNTAEAKAIPIKSKLEEAQTAAALWKEEPATGLLRNIQTGESLSPGEGGMAILDAPSAAVLGKQPGDHVPLKIAKQAKDIADAGVTYQQANGHNWLVDKQGNKLKDMGVATPIMTSQMRIEGMGQMREYPVIDSTTGALQYLNAADLNKSNQTTPGRYIPAGEGSKAMGKTALIEDIRGNIQNVRTSLQNPKMPEFSVEQRAQIAMALGGPQPATALSAAFRGGVLGSLSPEQQDYLINMAQLKENAMAMRSVLGAGQGSEDMRSAITATIPGPNTPSKEFAQKQLDKFEQVLNRLERGVPNVPLRNTGQTGGQGGGGTAQPTHRYNPQTKKIEAIP